MSADWVKTAKYLSLTTFRRDGTPVATPVWFAIDKGGRLVIHRGGYSCAQKLLDPDHIRVGTVRDDPVSNF